MRSESDRAYIIRLCYEACERQLDLKDLASRLDPSDFERGVLTCMVAIKNL